MGGRYLVTGVQLGMLIAIPNQDERERFVLELMEKSFIFDSQEAIEDDVIRLVGSFPKYRTSTRPVKVDGFPKDRTGRKKGKK